MLSSTHALAQSRWLGPGILLASALLLALLGGDSILYWLLFGLSVALTAGSFFTSSRWLVALPGVFTVSLLAFFVQGVGQPASSLAIVVSCAGLAGIALWALHVGQVQDIAVAYAAGLGLSELFVMLIYWPINSPSRALVLTAASFLLFEFVDRRSRGLGFHEILGTVGLVAVAVVSIVFTADWQTF